MVTIVVTERALQDLRDIRDYSIEEWGQTAADKYLDDFDAGIGRLAEMPSLLRKEPQIASGLYFYRVRKDRSINYCCSETRQEFRRPTFRKSWRLSLRHKSDTYCSNDRKHFLVCDMFVGTVVVLTVIHCSMDLPERLADLQPTSNSEVELLHRKLQQEHNAPD